MTRAVVVLAVFAGLLGRDSEEARLMYQRGDYAGAASAYAELLEREPGSALISYNLGTSLLAAERFDEARPYLEAAARAGEPAIRQAAHYNLGNSALLPAFRAAPEAAAREERLRRAIEEYKRALLLDPKDYDAKWNLELARRLLERGPPPPADSPGAGGGGGEGAAPGQLGDPSPQPDAGAGPQPRLSPEEAEELLSAAEERELGTQLEKLRRPQPRIQSH